MTLPDPTDIARHYTRFRVGQRVLLTGHSHQAWPDVARDAQIQAWDDAAQQVDDKWDRAFAMADRVRQGYAYRLDDPAGDYALAANTHELLVRFLSALPLHGRPRLVTTDGEFHTIRRQLQRLGEVGLEIAVVPAEPVVDLPQRLADAVDDRTAAVLVSCVLYRSGRIVRGLGEVQRACARHGAELLIDAYHAVNIVPFSVREEAVEGAYVVGGGYKYCQLGEGNAFLRVPAHGTLRPVVTGWFAEFAELAEPPEPGEVPYGKGAARFAGATYDPVSHYRGAAAWDFFAAQRLDVPTLRALSQRQIGRLADRFDALDLDPKLIRRDRTSDLADRGGFLVLETPHAGRICRALREHGVWVDHRDEALRLGPAPYVTDDQLDLAIARLDLAVRTPAVERPL
ncbi:kynureninase [bacterium]|nr:kynureninase [bacterium]